jgi:hypothetical protein
LLSTIQVTFSDAGTMPQVAGPVQHAVESRP